MRNRIAAGVAAGLTPLAALAITVIPVQAGSNGQELQYVVGCFANYSETTGYNQNAQYVDAFFYTPAAANDGCYQDPWRRYGWWWGGTVTVQGWWGYDGSQPSGYAGSSNFYIPWSQSDYDWITVQTPS